MPKVLVAIVIFVQNYDNLSFHYQKKIFMYDKETVENEKMLIHLHQISGILKHH